MKLRLITALIGVSLVASGCASFRDYEAPEAPESLQQLDLEQADNARIEANTAPVIEWWDEFSDPRLSSLVEQALEANPDVRIAYANLQEARALSREVGYDRQPSVNAGANASRNLNSQESVSGNNLPRTNNSFQAGFDAGWELDLFNRISSRIETQAALTDAARADLQQIYVTIAAEVARAYVELRGAQHRLDIAERNQQNQAETYELTQVLLDGGRATALDVSRAETQLTLTKSTIPPLQAAVTAAINRLSVLTGQVPDALRAELSAKQALPELPVTVAVGDAGSLLKRRPDIRSAERTLAASVSSYNVAVSDLFPTVRLLGSLGFVATNLSSFGTSALAGSVGPSLEWQVFNRDAVRARIDQADARSQAQLAFYDKTVLAALEETHTAVSDFAREEERRATLQQAAKSALHSAELARQRFDEGYDDFLDVLDAERTLLETEDTLANSEISAVLNLIAIYKALGGGWQVKANS
ncbi:efflux transporter outer membrane subunit [uncultured Methylophaga sp.]|uniref:efflux transporter outer membrane subunit n=1 Tax=uncultured Methylophaga sp. TaxID=285271 RepID=UPI00262F2738|nr:efflux transporter outer membrane subunit [uncultured Methylophaga sp.]